MWVQQLGAVVNVGAAAGSGGQHHDRFMGRGMTPGEPPHDSSSILPLGEQGRRGRSFLSGLACGFGAGGGHLSSTPATNKVTHFSGLRLDSRRLSSSIPSSPSSASYNGTADASTAAASGLTSPTARHSFLIGTPLASGSDSAAYRFKIANLSIWKEQLVFLV